ncbi:hypothetical protein K438DRAFT_1867060, partial [Mycena galopus ATCC 62051]
TNQLLCLYVGEQRSGDRDLPVAFFSGNGAYRDRDRCLPKQRAICIYLCGPVGNHIFSYK